MVEEMVVEDKKVIGEFRVQISEDGQIVGDSGWCENQITDLGAQYYLVENLMGSGASRRVTHMGIGTGTAPAVAGTNLEGELSTGTQGRGAVSTSVVASRTAQFTFQFASSHYSTRGPNTIQNLGLFYSSAGGSIFAGNIYTTSQWASNQDVNATYQVRFP